MRTMVYLLGSVMISAHSMSYAYIYHIQVMQQKGEFDRAQRVIALSDYHDKSHPATVEQKICMRDLLKSCKARGVHVIVEDLSSANNRGVSGCGPYLVNSRGGVLGGLSNTCKRMNLEVSNLEYRFCRVAAFAPLLNGSMIQGTVPHPAHAIYMHDVYEEIAQQIEKIRLFNDGPLLNAWYAHHITLICRELEALCSNRQKSMSIAQYMHHHSTGQERLLLLKKLLTFDSILFDLELVHTIVNSNNKKIVVIAGGMHIENMCTMLEKVGYVCTHATDKFESVYNPMRYVKSVIQGGKIGQPAALDLKTIKPHITQ